MSKAKQYPGDQPFNVTPRHNLTKKNSWWKISNNNNGKRK